MADELTLFTTLQSQLNQLETSRGTQVEDAVKSLYSAGVNASFLGSGWGEYDHQIINNFCRFNRYGTRYVMDNYVRTGYTFMTRPELNLTDANLGQNRIMSLLKTDDFRTTQFALRAYLDTRYARLAALDKVMQCPFLDWRNPFFTLVTNNLTDFSGGPTYQIEVHTEEGGFYGESQSFAIGSDSYRKPFDLQIGILDPIGGPITAAIKFWTLYMALLTSGEMIMYPDQIDEQYLNYTVSFYRFLLDPSMQYIQRWVKYTGCFPISRPGASVFDYNTKDVFADGCRKFSIGFRCGSGMTDEDDPIVIQEFNTLAERYFPPLKKLRKVVSPNEGLDSAMDITPVSERQLDQATYDAGLIRNQILPEFNYTGVPYITPTLRGPRLDIFRERGEYSNKVIYQQDETTKSYYPVLVDVENAAANLSQLQQQSKEQSDQLLTSYYQQVNQIATTGDSTQSGSITFV